MRLAVEVTARLSLIFTLSLVACGGSMETVAPSNKSVSSSAPLSESNDVANEEGSSDSGNSEDSDASSGGNADVDIGGSSVASTPPPSNTVQSAAESFFLQTMVPLFEATTSCFQCHSAPRFGGNAPLTLYSYSRMRALLVDGAATNNSFINRVRNIVPHPGGDRCPGGLTGSPCKEILQWAALEDTATDEVPGQITFVDATGYAEGWAVDFAEQARAVTVNLYVGGPSGTGQLVAAVTADQIGVVGGFSGSHTFRYQLPSTLRDGAQRTIYAYGIKDSKEYLLAGSPYRFVAFSPTPEGQIFFANSVLPRLQCAGCHFWDYSIAYSVIINPSPLTGGTGTNNQFYVKASGGGIDGHSGGNLCGQINGLCDSIQQWWNIEFGP